MKADNPPPGDDTSIAPFADDNGGDDSSSGFESSPFGFFLAKPADKIEITIRDRNKGIVRTITIDGETKPDIYDKTWTAAMTTVIWLPIPKENTPLR